MTTRHRHVGAALAGGAICAASLLTGPLHAQAADDEPLLAACPIDGDHEFIDSWGWRRSGGRSHQGIDVGANAGTELYAVRDGRVDNKRSNLGGNAIWLTTDDGDKFYYAHLDAFVGDDREVQAGELIGYVGSTGNAGGPHLHFEVHPGGSVENPFEHVIEACASEALRGSTPNDVTTALDTIDGTASAIDTFVDEIRAARLPTFGRLDIRYL